MRYLQDNLEKKLGEDNIKKIEIPDFILNNIKYSMFDWQKKAMQYFLAYSDKSNEFKKYPTHLMFNMATGSGKTLVMASIILYYYQQGYRHFIFLVNANNVVDKTENNLVDSLHNKYLFTNNIVINNQTINIKNVETFNEYTDDLEIKFTTIQKLHNDIFLEKENKTTVSDLQKLNLILIADEAHHLNANTKKRAKQDDLDNIDYELKDNSKAEEKERLGWEHTVINMILRKQGNITNNRNVLLEFTATIPHNNDVQGKYQDKIVYKFVLPDFVKAGYTKEINLIALTFAKKERILLALIFQWYRHKVALKHNISNFKPVILFRSKTIKESEQDYQIFNNVISNLETSDIDFLYNILDGDKLCNKNSNSIHEQGTSRIRQIINFINSNINCSNLDIIDWIKHNYDISNIILTNSEDDKKLQSSQESLLNSLEDIKNPIRAIFTVKRLTEGWDVLNLFDIVRLTEGQNSGGANNKTSQATVEEKQLIGRGVRYYPFAYENNNIYKRKFDNNLSHELRCLEELFYFTYDEDSKYISEIKKELKKDGYFEDDKISLTFALKDKFKNSEFYQNTILWYNEKKQKYTYIQDFQSAIRSFDEFRYTFSKGTVKEETVNFNKNENLLQHYDNAPDIEKLDTHNSNNVTYNLKLSDLYIPYKHIINKAVNIMAKSDNSLYIFEKLHQEMNITSVQDLFTVNYLGGIEIKYCFKGYTITDMQDFINNKSEKDKCLDYMKLINNHDILNAILKLLGKFEQHYQKQIKHYEATPFKHEKLSKIFPVAITKTVKKSTVNSALVNNKDKDFYILDQFAGTSEERSLIEFIDDYSGNLDARYEYYYLLRNEEVYTIYDFDQCLGFQPDFLLFLKHKTVPNLYYQVFIEPKGADRADNQDNMRKQDFLKAISAKYCPDMIVNNENDFNSLNKGELLQFENKYYFAVGLPFYNHNDRDLSQEFVTSWSKEILGSS